MKSFLDDIIRVSATHHRAAGTGMMADMKCACGVFVGGPDGLVEHQAELLEGGAA